MRHVIGWDIGGVNTKAALVVDGAPQHVITRAFELQRAPDTLAALLGEMAHALSDTPVDTHAVTMTAELSQMFRTKRDGVRFVLDAVERTFPGTRIAVFATDGAFISPDEARIRPLLVAAANWVATAQLVAGEYQDALLVDIGTTTADLIPILDGKVVARGRTDPDRLASGELVYTGAVRTPIEAIVREVPLGESRARVSAEGFALTGDVYVWRGELDPVDYDAATPDGRPSTKVFAGERLARVVCADREMLDDAAVTAIADTVATAQVDVIGSAIQDVLRAHPAIETAVVTGLGAMIGRRAAEAAGLRVVALAERLGADGARSAPATAVALLLHAHTERVDLSSRPAAPPARPAPPPRTTVLKLGGSLLSDPQQWRQAIAAISAAATSERLVVVPGGGPFADAVRRATDTFGLSDDSAHWMAIAGMDQHAEMIAAAGDVFVRVDDVRSIERVLDRGRVAVVAPARWLRDADPLPHSWDITSDSLAAWIAAEVGAARLVLIKTAGATGPAIVDRGFHQTVRPGLPWSICDASSLRAQLASGEPANG